MQGAGEWPALFHYAVFGSVRYSAATPWAGIRFVMRMPRRSRDLHIANKAVVDHDPLGTILADPLRFKHINVVDQLSQQRRCQVIHLHKPLITDLSGGIVLIELFIGPGNHLHQGRLHHFRLSGGGHRTHAGQQRG